MYTPKRQHPFIPTSNTVAYGHNKQYGRHPASPTSPSSHYGRADYLHRRRPYLRYLYPARLKLLVRHRFPFLRPLLRSSIFRLTVLFLTLALTLELFTHNRSLTPTRPSPPLDAPFHTGCVSPRPEQPRENGVIIMLASNGEVETAKQTLANFERRFNRWYGYPYVFFNDREWDAGFIDGVESVLGGRNVSFEVLSEEYWGWPRDWSEKRREKARKGWSGEKVEDEEKDGQMGGGVLYAGKESYHHMCRFFAGKFYDHPALASYKWYWRLDSDVEYLCDMPYDPFVAMSTQKKRYGYAISLWEVGSTVPSLFKSLERYRRTHLMPRNGMYLAMMEGSWLPWPFRKLLTNLNGKDDRGDAWNFCHFWSNFEIADMDWFRSEAYRDLFAYLEREGGIYTERWGDAPIHSLAAALLLQPREIHYFSDYGYKHDDLQRCPANKLGAQLPEDRSLALPYPMTQTQTQTWDFEKEGAQGCRCACDWGETARWLQPVCQNLINRAVGGQEEVFGN